MSLSPELEAKILRYYHVEKWRIGTIARQLHVHHDTVQRVLRRAGVPLPERAVRPSKVDPYLPFIRETLERFPTLTASRLYAMVRERGYRGSADRFRHIVAMHRPQRPAEAYLRLTTMPGEMGQADWGHFGHLQIGRARRPLMAFVLVLAWSRQIFLQFFFDARMASFLRGHIAAFQAWNGLPRIVLYDNLKSAVLERQGDAIRFHPTLLEFAGHYRYEPRPVAPARGNEKGRVERAIRYVRDNFFAARTFADLDDLNAQARLWCNGQAADRLCPAAAELRVGQAFAQERAQLFPLPDNAFITDEIVPVKIGKTPYARFDLNDYSVPHTHVQRMVTVRATSDSVRILDGGAAIAEHARSYDRGAQIEDPGHIAALVAVKRRARDHRGANRLTNAAPASRELLMQAAARGSNLGSITLGLLRLLDRFGATELQAAIEEALAQGAPHQHSVRIALERRREARQALPPIAMLFPDHVRAKDTFVKPHRLDTYDTLTEVRNDD
ncbi:MAG TPA: IS21 family transposase [Candidatus Baltobacteraceae bacterium]|nr:IS21 family transposase [Candidatus Baltobacteraceae bacterium]